MSRHSVTAAGPDVLIIEDDPQVRSLLSEVLLQQWYTVVAVPDGAAALEFLQQHTPPGIVLMDLDMSGMNGWQFRERQLQNAALAAIPVAVISGVDASHLTLSRLGAVAFLHKPLDIPRLLALVEQHCRPPGEA